MNRWHKEEENARRERIDGDQKYINDLRVQRMRERAARAGDAETFKEQEQAIRSIHATGENKFTGDFSKKNLEAHFGPHGRHTNEYTGWTAEKYEQEALNLVQSRITDDIIGYKRLDGAVVRYRKSSNDLVIGYPPDGIATMYKPKNNPRRGYRYVIDKMKKKAIIHD